MENNRFFTLLDVFLGWSADEFQGIIWRPREDIFMPDLIFNNLNKYIKVVKY